MCRNCQNNKSTDPFFHDCKFGYIFQTAQQEAGDCKEKNDRIQPTGNHEQN